MSQKNNVTEKWKPLLVFRSEGNRMVPEDKWDECAEMLEQLEQRYKDDQGICAVILCECVKSWVNGTEKLFAGGIKELLEELRR